MNFLIRNERKENYRKVEELAREAFWNLYFPGCHEHFVIHSMRSHKDFISELTYVIEIDGEIVGAIFYTKSKIICNDNSIIDTISFGPVFVNPKFHRKGIGKKLISYSIEKAREKGYFAILTLGYPYHYEPYGFKSGKFYNISMEDGKFYKGLLVLPLKAGIFENVRGYILFSPILNSKQEDVEEFDKSFKPKEKKYQESQKEYEIACSQIE